MAQGEDVPLEHWRVDSAMFFPLEEAQRALGVMEIYVVGEGFEDRATPLDARLGDQPVDYIAVNSGGAGFSGTVARMPENGDRLYVGYMDGELEATEVVYRRPSNEPVA